MNRSEHFSSAQVGRWIFICVVGLGILLLVATAAVTVGDTETGGSPDCGAVSFAENDDGQFEIENVSQLQCIGEHNLDGGYVLTADIDASDTENWNSGSGFDPIGDSGNEFTGTFDGDGHTISNLYIGRPDGSNVGLFGHSTGDLSNVALERVDIEGEGGLNEGVGALAGRSEGAVSNVTVSGTVDGNERVGGLIGTIRGDGTVSVSSASVTVNATGNFAGGLVGESWGDIWNSYATGDVDGDNQVGGLVGFNDSGDIWNSYATGDVDGDNQVGGLVGENLGDISQSYATGDVGGDDAGGLIGLNEVSISDSYWDRATTNQEDAIGEEFGSNSGLEGFGFTSDTDPADEMTGDDAEGNMGSLAFSTTWETVTADDADASDDSYPILTALDRQSQLEALGVNEFEWIEDWYDLDDVRDNLDGNYILLEELDESTVGYDDVASDTANDGDGFDPIGDSGNEFTGHFDGAGHTISDLYIDRDDENDIGLFGVVEDGTVENVGIEDASVVGEWKVGGLVGENRGEVSEAYATGSVEGAGNDVGGLVGYNDGGTVRASYASGSVEGSSSVGGLVGYHHVGTLRDSYATSSVLGDNRVGGLVGRSTSTVSRTYASGSVEGAGENVGGLIGLSDATLEYSYWDKAATNQEDASDGFERDVFGFGETVDEGPAIEMQGINATVEMHRFDFESTWRPGDSDYPDLAWDSEFADTADAYDTLVAGSGIDSAPYQVTTVYELQRMDTHLDADFELQNDIDASATEDWDRDDATEHGFAPIGPEWDDRFTGTFDGAGHTISGLYIDFYSTDVVGMVAYTNGDTEIRDVTLADADVTGGATAVGSLVGRNEGDITNVSASGAVSGIQNVGGLVGRNVVGTISESSAAVDVDGRSGSGIGAGGLVGRNVGEVRDSYATGTVSGHNNRMGGLVGHNFDQVRDSYATGNVTSSGDEVGGLVGRNEDSATSGSYAKTISGSYATGDVDGPDNVGGLTGRNFGYISESYATGAVEGTNKVGGLVGENIATGSTISQSYATGAVDGSDRVGGLVGDNGGGTTISELYWDKGTTGQSDATGLNYGTSEDLEGFGQTSDSDPAIEMQGINAAVEMHGLDFESTWWVRINPDEYPGLRAFENGLDPTIDSTNDPVNEGETLSVDVTVTNTDATERTQDVTLSVDGEAVDIEENLTVSGDDSQQLTLNWKTESGDAGEHDVVVTTADTADVATVQVNETHSVSGTVEDTTFETGIGNVVVTISGDSGEFTAETDENGEYTVENVPGSGESYDVIVDPVGWEVASTTTTVDGENVTGVDIEITGDASNKVTLRDWVTDALLEGGTMTAEHESFGAADVTTDENGEAEITIPGGFDYDFTYSKAG